MNIKEHIEAGHYERDGKGRALVPMGAGRMATIYCTDHPGGLSKSKFCILGRDPDGQLRAWDPEGANEGFELDALGPPRPRKERVKRYGVFLADGTCWSTYADPDTASRIAGDRDGSVVTLHGEREVPW
mgnify:CR=1 FL=1